MHQSHAHPPLAAAPPPAAEPKRRGNPDLHLAPRCGARTRAGCPCRAPAIRGKLRCRMHGGRSTGPRTAEGMARLRAARTVHGSYSAESRAFQRYTLMLHRRGRVGLLAVQYADRLPAELAARLDQMPPELASPPWPAHGLTPAEDRAITQAERAALAPWRQAIAFARRRWGRPAGDGARRGRMAKAAGPHAPEAAVGLAGMCGMGALLAGAFAAKPHAPESRDAGAALSAAGPYAPDPETPLPLPPPACHGRRRPATHVFAAPSEESRGWRERDPRAVDLRAQAIPIHNGAGPAMTAQSRPNLPHDARPRGETGKEPPAPERRVSRTAPPPTHNAALRRAAAQWRAQQQRLHPP